MCQHLEDTQNSVNQYSPNDQCMLQNHIWVKDSFNMQDRPMYFNTAEYEKFIDIVSYPH